MRELRAGPLPGTRALARTTITDIPAPDPGRRWQLHQGPRLTPGDILNITPSGPAGNAALPGCPPPQIQAIETRYAGCLFRSRLEARWAVFFDALGIAWDYEAQGYECYTRITRSPEDFRFWYLPDFWLPGLNVHVEVKGQLSLAEYSRLIDAAACLDDLLVCGRLPRPAQLSGLPGNWTVKSPTWLHMRKGGIYASAWPDEACLLQRSLYDTELANDAPEWVRQPAWGIRWLLEGSTNLIPDWETKDHGWREATIYQAFTAARSARFEHGQSGAPR